MPIEVDFRNLFKAMKNQFKLFMLIALGATAIFIQSCKEVEDEPSTTTDPTCYMLTSDIDSVLTTYAYNSDNMVISATTEGETTTFSYTDGKLTGANDGITQSTFIYEANANTPNRINLTENDTAAGYIILESSNNLITKIEYHDQTDQIQTVNYVTYDADGNLTSLQIDEWDPEFEEFATFVTFTGITNDGKKNPFQTSLALICANIDEAVVYGKTNITGGNLVVFGQALPFTAVNTYNDNDYSTSTTINALGLITSYQYTFDCK